MFNNNRVVAFLTVRTKSTRLPEKCLLPFGATNVLGHTIFRAKFFNIEPIVCTSLDSSDDKIEQFCKENNFLLFRGSLHNKISRWLDCARYFGLPYFHTLDVDDPFFDHEQVFESISLLKSSKMDVVYPSYISSLGSASVGYSIRTDYLEKVASKIEAAENIEMVDEFFKKYNFSNSTILISKYPELDSVRLTLDYPEDYWLLRFIEKVCGPNCTRAEIQNLFFRNPDLHKINWFRNIEWQSNQFTIRKKQQI
jgi:spore coat polysaccharide biosynthesis protein SpsF (cytidylyltransferase family)